MACFHRLMVCCCVQIKWRCDGGSISETGALPRWNCVGGSMQAGSTFPGLFCGVKLSSA